MKRFFRGVGTALITPFNEKGVDFACLERLIERQIKGGADALIVLGTTGEPASMTEKEKRAVMEFSVKTVKKYTRLTEERGAGGADGAAGGATAAVQDGEIYMESAECPDQICVEHGPLRPGGTPIVCLPNRLSIQWIERDAAVDAVSRGR